MKRWSGLLFVIIIAVFVSIDLNSDRLAVVFWQKYRLPQTAILFDRNNFELAMSIGEHYFNGAGGAYNIALAQKAYEKAVSINPEILWGHYQLARIYFVKGDFARAFEEINKELEYNPENLRSLYIRGLIYGYRNEAGDLEKAEVDFRRFTEWAPSEWAGYNDLAWILFKEGKYADAETELGRAFTNVLEANQNSWLWNARGVAELNLKKYFQAAGSFKRAKRLAEKLTVEEWVHSYPGNNPETSRRGLTTFLEAINENLRRAEGRT